MPEGEDRLLQIEKKLGKLMDKFKVLDDLNHNMQVLHKSFGAFNQDFEEFRSRFEEAMKDVPVLKKAVEALQAENRFLKEEMKQLREGLEENHNSAKSCDMEIMGISPSASENLKQKVLEIGAKVGVKIKDTHLKKVVRLSGKRDKPGVIHVTFSDVETCKEFLVKARKAKLKSSDVGQVGGSNFVFFNESLSPYSRQLLYLTRNFRREESWKYVWVKDGKIFLRKADKEPAVRISCQNDLLVIKK